MKFKLRHTSIMLVALLSLSVTADASESNPAPSISAAAGYIMEAIQTAHPRAK